MSIPAGATLLDCCCTPPDPCAALLTATEITVIISDVTNCSGCIPYGGGGGSFRITSGTANGTRTLTIAEGGGSFVDLFPDVFTLDLFASGDCSGDATSVSADLFIRAACNGMAILLQYNGVDIGGFGAFGGIGLGPFTNVSNPDSSVCATDQGQPGLACGYGGSGTIEPP